MTDFSKVFVAIAGVLEEALELLITEWFSFNAFTTLKMSAKCNNRMCFSFSRRIEHTIYVNKTNQTYSSFVCYFASFILLGTIFPDFHLNDRRKKKFDVIFVVDEAFEIIYELGISLFTNTKRKKINDNILICHVRVFPPNLR